MAASADTVGDFQGTLPSSYGRSVSVMLLVVVVIVSAIGVAQTRYDTRRLFVELEQLKADCLKLEENWGKLQLEESTYSTHGAVEDKARSQLDMLMPALKAVEYLSP